MILVLQVSIFIDMGDSPVFVMEALGHRRQRTGRFG